MKKIIFVLILVILVSLLYVKGQVELVRLSYQIRNETRQVEEIVFFNRSLEYELASLKSPAALEKRFAAVDSQKTYLTAWKVAGVINTPRPGGYDGPKILAAARPRKNVLAAIFNGLVPEASANGVK